MVMFQLRMVAALLALICLVVIIYASCSSPDNRPRLYRSEDPIAATLLDRIAIVERLGAFAALGFFTSIAVVRPWATLLFVVTVAALFELPQVFVPGRDARFMDAAEKAVGGIVGALIGTALLNWWEG
jgi:hypothetical protein